MENKQFFHQLTQEQLETEVHGKLTWGQVMEQFDQPTWCNYPEALSGDLGCWTLCDFPWKINKELCSTCPEFKHQRNDEITGNT